MKKSNKLQDGQTRRQFLGSGVLAASASTLALGGPPTGLRPAPADHRDFKISLAAWSLHKALFSNLVKMIDLPRVCRDSFGIEGLELVNVFFPSPHAAYLNQLNKAARDSGVKILLIMVDQEGELGHSQPDRRKQAVKNHFKWVDVAHQLGCHSIRVNMYIDDEKSAWTGRSFRPEVLERLVSSFRELVSYAESANLSVMVENHGGVSSNADALVQVMEAVGSPHLGTLPDFGNFPPGADKYEAIRKMMPFAKAVSAKCFDFDAEGNETTLDYERLLKIVVDDAGYDQYLGIEYEGDRMTEYSGVSACKALLERLRKPGAG